VLEHAEIGALSLGGAVRPVVDDTNAPGPSAPAARTEPGKTR